MAAVVTVVAAIFGIPVANRLSPTGFEDPNSESAVATRLLAERFGQGDQQLVILLSGQEGVDSVAVRGAGVAIVDELRRSPHVATVTSDSGFIVGGAHSDLSSIVTLRSALRVKGTSAPSSGVTRSSRPQQSSVGASMEGR